MVNLSLRPELLSGSDRDTVAELIRTFFRRGGMQIQVSLVDRATLQDAVKHPEAHAGGCACRAVSVRSATPQASALARALH